MNNVGETHKGAINVKATHRVSQTTGKLAAMKEKNKKVEMTCRQNVSRRRENRGDIGAGEKRQSCPRKRRVKLKGVADHNNEGPEKKR